jgi:hypothetical protein
MDTCGTSFNQAFPSGDDIPLSVQFYQADNVTPKDMTGYTVGMTVKATVTDPQTKLPVPDSAALYEKDLAGNTSGLFPFKIPGQTAGAPTLAPGEYYLDVKRWDSTGTRTTVLTTALAINESVTQRAAPSP